MKKLKGDVLRLACLLLAAALLASGLWLFNIDNGYDSERKEVVTQYLSSLVEDLDTDGLGEAKRYYIDGAEEWLGNANGNLIVFDRAGKVLASANGNFLDGGDTIRLLTPRYYLDRPSAYGGPIYTGLALLVDGQGKIVQYLRLLGNATACGEDNLAYDGYFPPLNAVLYRACAIYTGDAATVEVENFWPDDADGEDGLAASGVEPSAVWMYNPNIRQTLASATQAEVDAVERYCAWEADGFQQAGEWCAQAVTDARGELTVLAIFEDNAQTNAEHVRSFVLWQWFCRLVPYWMLGLAVWVILVALWVLRDARKRDFMPALWGILALLGNVVTLVVYLIVRPRETGCPQCGAALRRDYAVCPMCGFSLRERCPDCGRALEESWSFCPYCGRPRGQKE